MVTVDRGPLPDADMPTCLRCGTALVRKSRGRPSRYCSRECQVLADTARRALKRAASRDSLECLHCHRTFAGQRNDQKFCGRQCNIDFYNEKQAINRPTRPCEDCGQPITHRTRRKLCEACRLEHAEVQRLRHIGHTHRRRLHPGAKWEPFEYEDLFGRDGWICWICHFPVSQEAKYPDPACPSVDHVHPLSKGGDHTLENSRLAHFSCNSRRGNRVWTTAETSRSQEAIG